jgi:Ser/Thr protein kinase RdoA (MazF antagonist)
VSVDQLAQEELAHIGRMIAELERVAAKARGEPMRHAVMQQAYWQRRIDALIDASANAPLRRDADALRERLADVFADARARNTGYAGQAARETGSRK